MNPFKLQDERYVLYCLNISSFNVIFYDDAGWCTQHKYINGWNLIVKTSPWRLEVPFYDWKPYIHPISNTFSIVRPLSSLSVLHTRNYKGKERSFILLPPNRKFNFVEIHRKSDLSFLRHAAFSKNPKLRKETKRLKVNYIERR